MASLPSDEDVFQLKRISFLNRQVNICCQNNNGPCPLLGLANVLLLRGVISLPLDVDVMPSRDILSLVVHRLLESNPPMVGRSSSSSSQQDALARNQERNLNDVMSSSLPRLISGLDVNVGFRSIVDFEFTAEMAIFDLLDIRLVHGWLVDDDDPDLARLVGRQRYNELVQHVVLAHAYAVEIEPEPEEKCSLNSPLSLPLGLKEKVNEEVAQRLDEMLDEIVQTTHERDVVERYIADQKLERRLTFDEAREEWRDMLWRGLRVEAFLDTFASQLTQRGLERLESEIRERELCVLFQGNHFSTLFKWRGRVYRLVTDLGYRSEPRVIWEHLSDICGNTEFVSESFEPLLHDEGCVEVERAQVDLDLDYQLALSLQEESPGDHHVNHRATRGNHPMEDPGVSRRPRPAAAAAAAALHRHPPPQRPAPKSQDGCSVQ